MCLHGACSGYVTDHSGLLQEYSKLYHYLAGFEPDLKRRVAMETRRVDMLAPLLRSLNKISYEVIHKQIAYELGETVLTLVDCKLDKVRLKQPLSALSESSFKRAELTKHHELCAMGLAMFQHFIYMYADNHARNTQQSVEYLQTLPLYRLASEYCQDPDESKLVILFAWSECHCLSLECVQARSQLKRCVHSSMRTSYRAGSCRK
jgi:hypothetical protein